MNKKTTNENLVNNSNQTQNEIIEMKEVSQFEYYNWYQRLFKSEPSDETLNEFHKEVQNWNLYDLTYNYKNKNGNPSWIRVYGIPTPYLQSYLQDYFVPMYDFTKNGFSNLRITPHDKKFRNTKLNNGSLQGVHDRTGELQQYNLNNWGERFLKTKN
jgi:hypothetical protein